MWCKTVQLFVFLYGDGLAASGDQTVAFTYPKSVRSSVCCWPGSFLLAHQSQSASPLLLSLVLVGVWQ